LEKKQLTMAFKIKQREKHKDWRAVVISVISHLRWLVSKSNRLIGIAAKQRFPRIAFSEHQQDAAIRGIISFVLCEEN